MNVYLTLPMKDEVEWPGNIVYEPTIANVWVTCPEVPVTPDDLVDMPELELVITASTGDNHINKLACSAMGIQVLSLLDNRSALDEIRASSEFTFLLILNALRRLDNAVQYGYWLRDEEYLRGHELYQKMVGLIGHGRIGKNIENWCRAFGAGVKFNDPYDKSNLFQPSLSWIFQNCHIVVICCSLTNLTKGLITGDLLRKMQRGACLINTARGEVIVEGDLEEVAVARPDLVFSLDVLSGEPEGTQIHSPLLNLDNVIITPHCAGLTEESNLKAAQICAKLLEEYEHDTQEGLGSIPC